MERRSSILRQPCINEYLFEEKQKGLSRSLISKLTSTLIKILLASEHIEILVNLEMLGEFRACKSRIEYSNAGEVKWVLQNYGNSLRLPQLLESTTQGAKTRYKHKWRARSHSLKTENKEN